MLPDCATLGVQNIATAAFNITAVPNPATDAVTFSAKGNKPVTNMNVTMYNAVGTWVCNAAISNKNSVTINIAQLPAGLYVTRVLLNGTSVTTLKIVVAK